MQEQATSNSLAHGCNAFQAAANDACAIRDEKTKRRVGRPRIVTVNPVSVILPSLLAEKKRPAWLDDILFGSILTAVGQSRSVSNVSMKDVRAALWLPTFETVSLQKLGYEKRQSERVIKAARFVANGIIKCLERSQPKTLERLNADAELEVSHSYYTTRLERYRPLKPVPDEIVELYRQGDYYGYGKALRDFRRTD
ncbi:hypothetical protein [Pseudomonas fluorescens]|uniref:hypothetical protein n=1 Tax=Pseudomonas fluorescens TaxID=294 RepID=UPI002B1D2909|nr:hypothetical protein [Pseudomonas fluorescens]